MWEQKQRTQNWWDCEQNNKGWIEWTIGAARTTLCEWKSASSIRSRSFMGIKHEILAAVVLLTVNRDSLRRSQPYWGCRAERVHTLRPCLFLTLSARRFRHEVFWTEIYIKRPWQNQTCLRRIRRNKTKPTIWSPQFVVAVSIFLETCSRLAWDLIANRVRLQSCQRTKEVVLCVL